MSQSTRRQAVTGLRPITFSWPELHLAFLWMLVPAAVVIWMGFMHPLRRLDFWWHLKVGEIIFTSREIPQVDLFSFTAAGQPFMYQQWLGEVLYYLTYRAGGFPLLIFLNTTFLLLAFVAIFHLCLEACGRLRAASLCSLIAALALGWYSNMRPQTYSFPLLAVYYWILWGYLERRRDYLWVLPLLMLLWVNLHGAFVLGIGVMGIVLGAELVRRVTRGPREDTLTKHELAKLALVIGLTLLATLANPETYRAYAFVRQLQVDPSSQLFVAEWQVPDVKKPTDVLIFYGPFFLAILVFLYARRRLNLTELGLFIVFTVLGLAARRSGIWFALISTPIVARHIAQLEVWHPVNDMLRRHPSAGPLVHAPDCPTRKRRLGYNRLNWAIIICLLIFTVMVSPWVRPHLEGGRWNRQLIEKVTPVGAMEYIADHELQGNIFHPQDYGDYLIWRLWPEQRSFIDGRVHLYGESFVRDYMLTFHDDRWESRIARYDIKYLLLPKDDERTGHMVQDARESEHWTLLYEDEQSVLFENQQPEASQ